MMDNLTKGCHSFGTQLEAKLKAAETQLDKVQLRLDTCLANCTYHELNEKAVLTKLETEIRDRKRDTVYFEARLEEAETKLEKLPRLPRYMRMQQPHKHGRFVYYADLIKILEDDNE